MLKRKLVGAIIGSLKDIKPPNWALTEQYSTYLASSSEDINWTPEADYYASIISRFVDGKELFQSYSMNKR